MSSPNVHWLSLLRGGIVSSFLAREKFKLVANKTQFTRFGGFVATQAMHIQDFTDVVI